MFAHPSFLGTKSLAKLPQIKTLMDRDWMPFQ